MAIFDIFISYSRKNTIPPVKYPPHFKMQDIRFGLTSTVFQVRGICLRPEAPLPIDMSDKYNFGTL